MSTVGQHESARVAASAAGVSARIRIRVRGLGKSYGALEVFRGVDFDLGEREIITIVRGTGENKPGPR